MTGVEWFSFLPAAVLVSLVPGANQILSIQHGARHGVKSAMCGLVGRFSTSTIHVALVAAGLSAVLVRSAPMFEALRWLGVVYLVYLVAPAGFLISHDPAPLGPAIHPRPSRGSIEYLNRAGSTSRCNTGLFEWS